MRKGTLCDRGGEQAPLGAENQHRLLRCQIEAIGGTGHVLRTMCISSNSRSEWTVQANLSRNANFCVALGESHSLGGERVKPDRLE